MSELANASQRIRLVQGNIALLPLDAVVTAANSALMGGGGVDGAIHRAAGPELLRALQRLDGCPEGDAVITPGFALPARWIVHAVGPIYVNGNHEEAETLKSTYSCALQRATENNVRTIAFPCISTGAFRYPRTEACGIAIQTVQEWLADHPLPEAVYFCVFDAVDVEEYEKQLGYAAMPVESVTTAG